MPGEIGGHFLLPPLGLGLTASPCLPLSRVRRGPGGNAVLSKKGTTYFLDREDSEVGKYRQFLTHDGLTLQEAIRIQ